jgi:spoIIIJ-associated protein
MDKIELVKNIVQEFLQKGFSDRYIATFTELSPTELKVDITGEGVSYLIGQYGKTLLAFQSLVRQVYMNQSGDYSDEIRIIIDVDGYKNKRVEKIKELAKNAAEKAVSLGQEVALPAMNAFERHVVHEYIQETFPGLHTGSMGDEPNRRVVLAPGAGQESNSNDEQAVEEISEEGQTPEA